MVFFKNEMIGLGIDLGGSEIIKVASNKSLKLHHS